MKKLVLLIVCLFSFSAICLADNDKPISYAQLPVKAQTFIKKHFHAAEVQKAFVDEDGDEFEVQLKGGLKIEFGKNGHWKEVESKRRAVPKSIIPQRLLHEIHAKYGAQVKVLEISRDEEEIEVKLSNGEELKMDRQTKKVEIDD